MQDLDSPTEGALNSHERDISRLLRGVDVVLNDVKISEIWSTYYDGNLKARPRHDRAIVHSVKRTLEQYRANLRRLSHSQPNKLQLDIHDLSALEQHSLLLWEQDVGFAEIARRLEISRDVARRTLARAYARLRVQAEGEELEDWD